MRKQHTHDPPNAETDLAALGAGTTPLDDFYTRCNFPIPDLDVATWRLEYRVRSIGPAPGPSMSCATCRGSSARSRWNAPATVER